VSSNEGSQTKSARLAVADERCEDASVASLSAGPELSHDCEKPASGKCGRATLEGEYLSEFIDILVRKGAQVVIHTENRR
jgi:hypothetical protein